MDKITSIIIVHWGQNGFRSDLLRICLLSVIDTTKHLPAEIVVVDNGENFDDSGFLLGLVHNKKIQHYVRNSDNLYFGYARNLGLDIALGEYIVISDNDIEYKQGWLDKCLKFLEQYPDKKYAITPLKTDRQHRQEKYWDGTVEFEGEDFLLNMRAGSNSWVMKRSRFDEVGKFRNHHIAGSHWADKFVNSGYRMATMEKNPLAKDLGFKKGYNIWLKASIGKTLTNGQVIYLNN